MLVLFLALQNHYQLEFDNFFFNNLNWGPKLGVGKVASNGILMQISWQILSKDCSNKAEDSRCLNTKRPNSDSLNFRRSGFWSYNPTV